MKKIQIILQNFVLILDSALIVSAKKSDTIHDTIYKSYRETTMPMYSTTEETKRQVRLNDGCPRTWQMRDSEM